MAFTDVGGWDTHVNEVGPQPHVGQLANLLSQFGDSLAAFSQDMGDRMADITVVTMSEFGRTARENGNRGTDHGHANVMFAMGGSVRGGNVYGDWPGLNPNNSTKAATSTSPTDFALFSSELVSKQMGNRDLSRIFPGFEGPSAKGILSV